MKKNTFSEKEDEFIYRECNINSKIPVAQFKRLLILLKSCDDGDIFYFIYLFLQRIKKNQRFWWSRVNKEYATKTDTGIKKEAWPVTKKQIESK